MELSPKQQTIELLKKAQKVLILGHQNPESDLVGSGLSLCTALKALGKKVQFIVTDPIPNVLDFLPNLSEIQTELNITEGKILRIDTERIPVTGIKYQKTDKTLDVILEAEKNLKFEFIEIINGQPKPDLILVLDTPEISKIDRIYNKENQLFLDVPIVNIDHHAGNEYFGTVNLIDLTATSTAEILVSLFEALGVKISDPDTATLLLCGIIADTQSFRSAATTPKSLTVAAQLLAAGGRQQEIISHLYKKQPIALLKLWRKLLEEMQFDKEHNFAWTKIARADLPKGLSAADALDSAEELLENTPEADMVLVLAEKDENEILGRIKSEGIDVLPLAKLFDGQGITTDASFKLLDLPLSDAELLTLKKIYDLWEETGHMTAKNVWEVIDSEKRSEISDQEKLSKPETEKEVEETTAPEPARTKDGEKLSIPETIEELEEVLPGNTDAIDSALQSIEQDNKESSFTKISDVIEKKKKELGKNEPGEDIDVFDEDEN